jgi:hypothetical protein
MSILDREADPGECSNDIPAIESGHALDRRIPRMIRSDARVLPSPAW